MISLQSHNQVLYHLTQFTSAITPRSATPLSAQVKQKNDSINKKTEDILCQSSFSEAVKSCNELALDKLNIQNLITPLRISRNDVWDILEQLSKTESSEIGRKNNKWKVSYVSGSSFAENKRGLSTSQLSDSNQLKTVYFFIKPQRRFLRKFCSLTIHPNSAAQVRYFKTDRSIKAELDRNPTLSTRIRKWIGLNTQSDSKLGELSGDEAISNAANREYRDIEKLSKLLGDKYAKLDEPQRIKVAFGEGYLAGRNQKPFGRVYKVLKFSQQIITTVIVLIIFIFFIATTEGSMFKMKLGNKSQVDPEEINVKFNDVKGVEDAKSELMDVVEFLRNPDKFSALGGKLPKGVLLVGPPGTGKTLLARAVAGEAGVPFFYAAGPEFDEIFVGQGARRVRDLFKAAKEHAPCVIFIDEIDSVGAKRTNSVIHPHANQTINQLLSEMDGFHRNEGVIVIGATNRRQDLDKALLRPGRFDSEVTVKAPDLMERKEIIDLYLGKVLTRDVNAELLAKRTIGFTGADIENMINQAALRAAIEGAEYVTMDHLERAKDKVIMGPEGKKKILDEQENRLTAYHEGGHALVSYFTKDAVPLHKVTILPRGQALGYTQSLPNKDTHLMTKAQMLASMDVSMGGRAAEELIFGQDQVTSGASSDFVNATAIAEEMVRVYGMSEKFGFRVIRYPGEEGGIDYSASTKELIDNEVRRLLQESYDRAKAILKNHSKEHKLLAEALLKYETLDAEDVKTLVSGKKLRHETANDVNRTVVDVPNNIM
ncbi:ATP-dependent zinc metalloprotease YME1L isoform X2 [Nasonia vitripennis]|uniref:AAA+ ATPase domain-containing protein n=1 Tax=Nasonia vitripennis TaxID=7425 RepID=A0A7M7T6U1_NASVI|nr:ATP-dependent zinc metalloprotease YME1L isoform X2 [Nasonia vitripennis]